jgi:hypothetical protein
MCIPATAFRDYKLPPGKTELAGTQPQVLFDSS